MLPQTSQGGASTWNLANCWLEADRSTKGSAFIDIIGRFSSLTPATFPTELPLEFPDELAPFALNPFAPGFTGKGEDNFGAPVCETVESGMESAGLGAEGGASWSMA